MLKHYLGWWIIHSPSQDNSFQPWESLWESSSSYLGKFYSSVIFAGCSKFPFSEHYKVNDFHPPLHGSSGMYLKPGLLSPSSPSVSFCLFPCLCLRETSLLPHPCLCQPHPLGCDVSISGPVQQMMSCNWVAASRGSLGSCAEGLFLLSNLSTSLIRKVGVIQTVPYSTTNFLFSRNTWFLSSVYNMAIYLFFHLFLLVGG